MCDREGCKRNYFAILDPARTEAIAGCDAHAAKIWRARAFAAEARIASVAADAARWQQMAPLINNLRAALDAGQIVSMRRMFATWGEDSRAALATIDAIVAATSAESLADAAAPGRDVSGAGEVRRG